MRLAPLLAVLGSLVGTAHANGAYAAGQDNTDGFLVLFLSVAVGLAIWVISLRGWRPRLQRSGGLPAARVHRRKD